MFSQNINSFLEKHNLQQSVGGSEVKNEEEDTRAVVTSRLIDHIFESISVLRELHSLQNLPSSSSTLTSTILSSLTIGMSDILRKLVNEIPPASGSTIQCSAPNHKAMELVVFGTEQHSYLLDHVFKVKRPSNGGSGKIICRHCLRDSISFDLKFYYCSQCHYVRCIFCQNHSQHQHHEDLKQKEQDHEQDQGTSEGRSWATIQLLIEAFPNTIGKVFPGDRLVFHELAARDPTGEVIESCVKIYKSGVYVTDINGELPLHWACMSGSNYHTINTLITAYPEGTHLANHSGKLPLHLACQHSDLEIIKLLIAANPDACSVADNHGWIPLHYALSVLPDPSFKIIELLLATYSGSVQTPTHQGYFPLHLYLRNRQSPSLWVIKSLLHYFPFGAFVTAGEQDELPLHLVIARDPPPLEIIASLVDINPEGCLQPSTATSWSESETPMSIAIKRAVKGGDLHILKDYLKNNQPVEIYWNVVRMMLLANKSYDPVLLGLSHWICRRWYVMGAYRKYSQRYGGTQSPLSATLSSSSPPEGSDDPMDRAFEFLVESIGSCPDGFRTIISFL